TDASVSYGVNQQGGPSVFQFHNHVNRDGLFVDPAITAVSAAKFHRDTTFDGTFAGHVYSSPLYPANGPGGKGAFYIATENNTVFAIGETRGKPSWQRNVGKAASQGAAGCATVTRIGST